MGLRGDFERAAQACDLHRDEVLHQLAHPLHGVFALHHDVEVEVVDQSDQQIVEFLMCTENEGETRHLVLAVTRLEVHEVDEIAHAGLERPAARVRTGDVAEKNEGLAKVWMTFIEAGVLRATRIRVRPSDRRP